MPRQRRELDNRETLLLKVSGVDSSKDRESIFMCTVTAIRRRKENSRYFPNVAS